MLTAIDSALGIGLRAAGPQAPPSLVVEACRRCSRRGAKHRLFGRGFRDIHRGRTKADGRFGSHRNRPLSSGVRAGQQDAGSLPDSWKSNSRPRYHPLEEIDELVSSGDGDERRLTNAETARTMIEVNSKATILFSGFIDDGVNENIVWSYLPYLTDEHGDIYFEMNNEKEDLQTLLTDDKLVKVVIGLDNMEKLTEMEVLWPSDLDFEVEEISSDEDDIDDGCEDDIDDGFEEDVMTIFEEIDELLSSKNISDWTNLETMQSCHPMYFAEKMVESISKINLDWMDQPPASIVIQGHLRPAFADESINIKKLPYSGDPDIDQSLHNGAAFYKLETINIQIVSAYGTQLAVKIGDFREARPDILAHPSANIISRLKAGGKKISQALKLLCMRQKGIHVEEAVVIGVDSLGFDLRVCSGRQVQTLRFAFDTQATSEYSAERQLNGLLFPRHQRKQQRWQQTHQGVDS